MAGNVLVVRVPSPMDAKALSEIRDFAPAPMKLGVLVLPVRAELSVLDRADLDDVEVTSDGETVLSPQSLSPSLCFDAGVSIRQWFGMLGRSGRGHRGEY